MLNRALCVAETVNALRRYTQDALREAHASFMGTLHGVPPPCTQHDGYSMEQLLQCILCRPWAAAIRSLVRDGKDQSKQTYHWRVRWCQ